MAQRVNIVLVDDVDGSPAAESVSFGLDGVSYEIDLSATNAAALRSALEPWVVKARRVGGRRAAGKKRSAQSNADDIRDWARANGYDVKTRGRVSAEIRAAYEAARA